MSAYSIALLLLFIIPNTVSAMGGSRMEYRIESMPEGYRLQAYDDCGVPDRQPHVKAKGFHTFSEANVHADIKARSVAWDFQQIEASYDLLDPNLSFILAVTYANEDFNDRTQSLWAGSVELHGPRPLPKGQSERLLFRLPPEVTRDGKLSLKFKQEGQVNVVVSAIELWAPAPSPQLLHIADLSALFSDLTGRVLDLSWDGVEGAVVRLFRAGKSELLAETRTGSDGSFSFERRLFEHLKSENWKIEARYEGAEASRTIPSSELFFDPVRYRPIPVKVRGLARSSILLDGVWQIDPDPKDRERDLHAPGWGDFRVPGQWLQQGYDIPPDRPAAVAKEILIPKEWTGYRIFLRFDAIHAGTRYWLNGHYLGYSENLFTPVEWEITGAARPGEANRLDLEMKVETVSERLSYASGYAFHNLGGIDRSVRLYALPPVHVKAMHLSTDLDAAYRDANLYLRLTLDIPSGEILKDPVLHLSLYGPDGKQVRHSAPETSLTPSAPGGGTVEVAAHVPDPLKWSAEKPRLYRLVLDLVEGGRILERIERRIGFRKIEVRGRQLYLNGQPIKLAGACHHEIDPLTGRADTMRHAVRDVRLLKEASLNYIRTSHYPPCQELLDAADRLGMYVEVEAPFCWVAASEDMSCLREVLTPTSAMIDYCHTHPGVILWSLANESAFNKVFEVSHRLCKALDPTRPTTFNNPDPKGICDIANAHYPPMPYDEVFKDDPRPLLLGEYFFPVCHEQTDVRIDPGLRELWAHGHSDPDSEWGKRCASSFDTPILLPGAKPGAWSHIYHSDRVIGGAIWAAIDEPFYLPGDRRAGYAWVHGFWGLIDAWRRPKPEWWLSKLIFSPIWFPARTVNFSPGQTAIRIPVENRYAFTDLSELEIAWRLGGRQGKLRQALPPGSRGEIEIPVPPGAKEGDILLLRVTGARKELITAAALRLGQASPAPLPQPRAGAPGRREKEGRIAIEGKGYRLVLDLVKGDLDAGDPAHRAPLIAYPALHITRFDFGDLAGPSAPPYAEFPDARTRVVDRVAVLQRPEGLEITIHDRYHMFAGYVRWLIDKKGMGRISYEYTYSGKDMNVREVGLKLLLKPQYDEARWQRWSEWEIFPEDHISRTAGKAKARRDPRWGDGPESTKPSWPWSLDQTELGTNDFRAIKLNIYQASLQAPDRSGVRIHARGDVHFRPSLAPNGVWMHLLSECRLGPVALKKGSRIAGEYVVELLTP